MKITIFPVRKLGDSGDILNTVSTESLSLPQVEFHHEILVDTGASVSVFTHLSSSPSAPGSGIQMRTAKVSPMNTYGSCRLALNFCANPGFGFLTPQPYPGLNP